ncbi:nuclear transport factor 2 family protein [Halorussus salinus]|uniref:nuclear transport factor 2 family protein n=1 Tax=Halorussus salinus TaxID=1364935 RepID=UPI0010920385|nr:nuclear transport factor 2 family protein [Halorussus salinus]
MNATETVEAYYEALRRGDPLSPYFAEREEVVKFGVGERLAGYEAVADGLREQTRTTDDWRVESRALRVTARETVAWFTDDVAMSWTATGSERAEETDASGSETRHSFETRWSGVLERDAGEGNAGDDGESGSDDGESETGDDSERDEPGWRFVQMHVSAPHEL